LLFNKAAIIILFTFLMASDMYKSRRLFTNNYNSPEFMQPGRCWWLAAHTSPAALKLEQ